MICEVNQAYLDATGTLRQEIMGRDVFDVFPDNPDDPAADGVRNLRASLERARSTGRPDSMAVQRYDIRVRDDRGRVRFEARYWSPVNTPVLDDAGTTVLLIHRVEDVTDYVRGRGTGRFRSRLSTHEQETAVDIMARGRDLQAANERLREVAVALQHAMLPAVTGRLAIERTATRYRPAARSMNVGGDWYDVTELDDEHLAVAVGDVVGHGLQAASAMGQLRAALVSATVATRRPDRALEVLDAFSRTMDNTLATTAVKMIVDFGTCTVTYSVAGHPPAILLRADGAVEMLEGATAPPLGVTALPQRRPCAEVGFASGDLLALYTDGLVERRGESIRAGIDRLARTLRRHGHRDIEQAADAILGELVGVASPTDDTALVLVAL